MCLNKKYQMRYRASFNFNNTCSVSRKENPSSQLYNALIAVFRGIHFNYIHSFDSSFGSPVLYSFSLSFCCHQQLFAISRHLPHCEQSPSYFSPAYVFLRVAGS